MRLQGFLWTILQLAGASASEYVDPNCPDYDLSLVCTSQCDDVFLNCIAACSDSNCVLDCNRDSIACNDACPCHTDCLEGCSGCENPICFCNDATNDDNLDACLSKNSKTLGQCILDCNDDTSCEATCVTVFKEDHSECPCQEKCPLGCPCNDYDCNLPEKKAILTLYSGSSSIPSVLIQPNGGVTENFELQMDDDTEVYQSCSATLNGELFVFGGYSSTNNRKKQISKIFGCGLKRIGDLNYDFNFGACGTYMFSEERIMICFGASYNTRCESYDGDVFHNHANSKNGHHCTILANIEGSPLAVGGDFSSTNKAEIYDISANTWTEIDDYPYHTSITRFATITTEQGALIIGGWDGSSKVATVACYNSVWSRLDDLHSARYGHRSIINGDKVYVIGGTGTLYTEIWSVDGQSKNIKLADPKLDGYRIYPELLLVDTTFCVKP